MTNQMTSLLIFHPQLVLTLDALVATALGYILLSPRRRLILRAVVLLAPLSPVFAVRLIACGIIVLCDLAVRPFGYAHDVAEKLADEFGL